MYNFTDIGVEKFREIFWNLKNFGEILKKILINFTEIFFLGPFQNLSCVYSLTNLKSVCKLIFFLKVLSLHFDNFSRHLSTLHFPFKLVSSDNFLTLSWMKSKHTPLTIVWVRYERIFLIISQNNIQTFKKFKYDLHFPHF